jgi:hypothetical protein
MSIQIVSLGGLGDTSPESLEPFLTNLLVDHIANGLLDTIISSFPLPVVDISTWIPALPPGSSATFGAESIQVLKGHVLGSGLVKEP